MRNCLLDSCCRIKYLACFIATYPPTALRTLSKGQGLHPARKNISLFPHNLFMSFFFVYLLGCQRLRLNSAKSLDDR